MTKRTPAPTHPAGASLNLGGDAWAHPDLTHALYPLPDSPTFLDGNTLITPYPDNPRRGDQDAITASLRDLGLYRALIVQRSTGYVLAGNHTLRALTDLGADRAPVTWVDVDDTRAAAIVTRDNYTSSLGADDTAGLLALLTSDPSVLALSGRAEEDVEDLQRMLANLTFAETALAAGTPVSPVGEQSAPIDVEGDVERVTVVVDAGSKAALYALLEGVSWVRDVADSHTRRVPA